MTKYKIIKSKHLTALEKKLILTSIDNNLQDVHISYRDWETDRKSVV